MNRNHVSLLLAVLALGACGGDEGDDVSVGGDRASARRAFQEAGVEFARCMRSNGVDIPDPKVGDGGFVVSPRDREANDASPAAERARRRCARILERVKPPELSEEQRAELRKRALAHARCMRRHGIDLPDPRFDGRGGASIALPRGFDPSDPEVRDAERECRGFEPRPPGG